MFPRLVYRLSIRFWQLGRAVNWLAKLPWVGPRLQPQLFNPDDNQAILIPVSEAVDSGENVVLPYALLPPLIEQASHRTILNHCMCREAEQCQTYPQELGCLLLGDGAQRLHPSLGRPVDVETALQHVDHAMDEGLMPTILHSAVDAFMLQIPFRRMLAICFCCDCCCTIRKGIRAGPPAAWETVARLPGLMVEVTDDCVGCGSCVDRCPVQAVTLVSSKATIGDACKGCGRCIATCPVNAIALRVDDPSRVSDGLTSLLEGRTTITG